MADIPKGIDERISTRHSCGRQHFRDYCPSLVLIPLDAKIPERKPSKRVHEPKLSVCHLTEPLLSPADPQSDIDLVDYADHYLVEVEVPGVKNTEDVKCRWAGYGSLMVYGRIPGHDIPGPADGDATVPGEAFKATKHDPLLLVEERRLGTFRRLIFFPLCVDSEHTEAKLEAGLLSIKVLNDVQHVEIGTNGPFSGRLQLRKKSHHTPEQKTVNIEVVS